MTKSLGKSQKAVVHYLTQHPNSTTVEIGASLYEKTSSCANESYGPKTTDPVIRRTHWARRILKLLEKRGVVSARRGKTITWTVLEKRT